MREVLDNNGIFNVPLTLFNGPPEMNCERERHLLFIV